MVAAPEFTVVGRPIPRVEGPDKVTGRAKYSADFHPPGVLWAKLVRSPLPHARIGSIRTERALAVPGVQAVLTAKDFPNKLTGRTLKDQPVLCDDRVRFVGDRVAVVAADTLEAAEEGALAVDVEYDELPAVFDPVEAMQPRAPLLHEDPRSYQGFHEPVPEGIPNACGYEEWHRGDVAQGFAQADLIVEQTFRTQLSHQSYLEPWACVVSASADEGGDRVEVWAAQKIPFTMRKEVARLLDLPTSRVRLNAVTEGADFGSKGGAADIVTGYYLSQRLGRPVKLVNTSTEDLISASPRHPSVTTIKTGVKRDGQILARETKVWFNRGAYGAHNPSGNGLTGGASRADGCYEIPNLHTEGWGVYTNQIPCGYMRAPGYPQMFFAVEAHMDLIARELGMDPVELRMRNLPALSAKGEEITAQRNLRAAMDAIGWASRVASADDGRATGKLIGRGLALASRGTGAGEGTSDITVNSDGTISAMTSMPDNGTGGLTVVVQVVAETFGVPLERVRLVRGDTDDVPIDVESGGSKMTNVAGNAAMAASEQVKSQLAPIAAQVLGAPEVEWARASEIGGRPGGWRSPDGRFISLEDLATEAISPGHPAAHAQVTMQAPRTGDITYCVQAAEVEVDPDTGEVELRHMVTVQDVGAIINAIGHQGQIEGALVQGIGYALIEELAVADGQVTTANLGDYKIPSAHDLPALTTINIPVATGPGPFNARGIGEIPTVPTAGAIANAVMDAIGAPMFDLPITAERVLAALDAKRAHA